MEPLAAPTPRRSFLQRFAAGTAALLAGGTATAHAAPAFRPSATPRRSDDAWLDRITGEHRQVFDLVEPNKGFGAAYALNYRDSYMEAHGVSGEDVTAVIVFRHFAMPLVVGDEVWAKYPIGAFIGVNDPETEAPATRNVFHDNIMMRPGLTYAQLAAEPGIVVVACNLALTVLSSLIGQQAGISAEEAKADWEAGLFPGVTLAPSGVYAVNRAQEHGCTYCYGG
ncbi:MAG TPA: hypothetical protein VK002_11005 [Rubricoccaceae bacterium]|nr:hypothetical protein [Rubricoccaceae bacterium]